MRAEAIFDELGLNDADIRDQFFDGGTWVVSTPVDGSEIARLLETSPDDLDELVAQSVEAQMAWQKLTLSERGEMIRQLGIQLGKHQDALGALVTLETGRVSEESRGEIQQMIDACESAAGLSRQFHDVTTAHGKRGDPEPETRYPPGVIGCITDSTFPLADWAGIYAMGAVCGNTMVWKPSGKALLCAIACKRLIHRAALACSFEVPGNLVQLLIGNQGIEERLACNRVVTMVPGTSDMGMDHDGCLDPHLAEQGGNRAWRAYMRQATRTDLDAQKPATVRDIEFYPG